MIYSLIPAGLFTFAGISLSVQSGRKFADLLAPVVLSSMILLYFAYITGFLVIGNILVCALCLILGAAALASGKNRKQALLQVLSTPSFRWYLAAIGIFLLFATGKYVISWDSLRLWGAVPKALHTTGALQLGSEALIYPNMQSYPPGMPLLGNYIASFSPVFPESALFFTYSYFGFVLFLPLLGKLDGGKKSSQLSMFLLLILLPRILTAISEEDICYYSTLYIDLPLGICCGYYLSRAFRFSDTDGFEDLCLILSCAGCALLKDSGAAFGLWGIAAMVIQLLLHRKQCHGIRKFITAALAAILLVGIWSSWKLMLNRYGVVNHLSMEFTVPTFTTLGRLFFYFLRTPVVGIFTLTGGVHMSLPAALLTVMAIRLLLSYQNEKTRFSSDFTNVLLEFFCYASFFLGYFLTFQDAIANQFYPSYVRYFCTLIMCTVYILMYDCFGIHFDYLLCLKSEFIYFREKYPAAGKLLVSTGRIIRCAIIICILFTTALILFDFPGKSEPIYAQSLQSETLLKESIHSDSGIVDVYMVNPEEGGFNSKVHHYLYLALLDDSIRIRNFYDTQDLLALGVEETAFLNQLIHEGYDYVYLTVLTPSMMEQFGGIFSQCEPGEENLIFRVEATGLSRIS